MTSVAVAGLLSAVLVHGASQGADVGSTMMLRDAAGSRFVEYNPVLAGQDRQTVLLMKTAELGLLITVDQMLEKRHKKGWVWAVRAADVVGSAWLAKQHLDMTSAVRAGRR